MVDSINVAQAHRLKTAETNRHNAEIKKLRAQNYKHYKKEVNGGEKLLTRMKNEYDEKTKSLKTSHFLSSYVSLSGNSFNNVLFIMNFSFLRFYVFYHYILVFWHI